MAYTFVEVSTSKTYATKDNAMRAVVKVLGEPGLRPSTLSGVSNYVFRVAIMPSGDGRFFPMIFGTSERDGGRQAAIQSGFNVVC